MKVYPEKLADRLAGELPGAFLIAGPERLLVEESCDAVRAAARRAGVAERIRLTADARFDWSELDRATETGSLFASRRLVEVELPTGAPGAEGGRALRSWLEQNGDDLLMVVCHQWKLEQEKAVWARAIADRGIYVPAWQVKPERLADWIANRLRSRGLAADSSVAAFLAARLEGNLLAAAQEVDRLALLCSDGRVDLEQAERAVADSARFDAFRLVELAFSGQTGAALRCVRGLRESDLPPQVIVASLARELDNTLAFARLSRNMPEAAAFRELRIWAARQGPVRAGLKRLGPDGLEHCLARLSDLDRMSKGRLAGDFWTGLERLVHTVAAGPLRAAG